MTSEKQRMFWSWFISLLAALTISSMVLNTTLTGGEFHNQDRVNLHKIIRGTANRPFIYRAMTPLTVRILTDITPEFARAKITSIWESRKLYQAFAMPRDYPVEGIWAFFVMLSALIGFFISLRLLILRFYDIPEFVGTLLALVALSIIPMFRSYFIYDFANLFIFTTCLYLITIQNWRLYYPCFLVACFTKETAVLLPFIIFLMPSLFPGKRKIYFAHIGSQFLLWAVIFVGLRLVYQSNPGQTLEFQFMAHNVGLLTRPGVFLIVNKYFMPGNFNILILISLLFFVFKHWIEKPLFLRRAVLILVPMMGLALLFGWLDETRMYYEAYPILFLLGMYSVMKIFNYDFAVRSL